MADETVGIELRAIDNASGTINRVGGALGRLGRSGGGVGALGQLGGILGRGLSNATTNLERYAMRLGFLAVGAGTAAVKWSIDFQKNMLLIQTQTGAGADEVARMTAGVKALVGVTATGPVDLSKMLYHIESVGVRGAEALDLLKTSALGVKVGLVTDFESVTNAMAAIKYSGISGVSSFAQSMSVLTSIVGTGNMRMQDLAHSFSTGVLGTAAAYGVSIQSLGAALAVLTDAGVRPQQAMYRLGYSMVQLEAPTAAAIKQLKKIGIGQYDLAKDLRQPNGIFVALTDLKKHLADSGGFAHGRVTPFGAHVIARSFGGGRFSASIIQLLGMLPRVKGKYDLIKKAQDEFDKAVLATQHTAAYQFAQLGANIQLIGVKIGDALVPGLMKINSWINDFIAGNQPAIDKLIGDLGSGFSSFVDKLMAVDWGAVANGLKSAAGFAGKLIDAFMSAPDWVKGLLITGFAVNKLTGGMVTDLAGFGIKKGFSLAGAIAKYLPGKLGAAGGLLAAASATPVYVVGGHLDGMLPSGPGGAPVGWLASLLGGGALLVLGGAVVALAAVALATYQNRGPQAANDSDSTGYNTYSGGGAGTRQGSGYRPQYLGNPDPNRPRIRPDKDDLLPVPRTPPPLSQRDSWWWNANATPLKSQTGDTHSELVRIQQAVDVQRSSQDRTTSETASVRMAVESGLAAVQTQLYDAVAALNEIAAKSWSVYVSPQQVQTANGQQASYGPTRTRQRSQITTRAGFGGRTNGLI